MEFWGVEVKAGESLKVKFEDDKILHLSQAALGESKKEKGNDSIPLFLKVDQQKLVLGTLAPATIPQLSFDLVFDKEFELSHNWKNGSIYFMGYKSVVPDDEEFSEFDDSDSGEDLPEPIENGKPEPKVEQAKAVLANAIVAKAKVKAEEPPKDAKDVEDDDEDSEEDMDDDSDDDDESDEDMSDAEDGSDDGTESEDEETPKKAEQGKKRPTESATKTPVPAKKAKIVSPQKTDGKKGGGAHTATPHPNKKGGKTPASSDKGKGQTPKSGGISCKSCSKTFNSDNALQSHSKAKHGGAS